MNTSLRKASPYVLLLVVAVLFVIKRFINNHGPDTTPVTNTTKRDPSAEVNRDRGFDRRVSHLQYSNHARCRMECRHISQAEVEDVMQNGMINYKKSDLNNARCPRYALEGVTVDRQDVRIIFAQCDESTTVVTVIDLDTDWTCHCPGDEEKHENRD